QADRSLDYSSLDDIYYFGGQSSHNQVAVLNHSPKHDNEITMKIGDVLGSTSSSIIWVFTESAFFQFHEQELPATTGMATVRGSTVKLKKRASILALKLSKKSKLPSLSCSRMITDRRIR